ncbi:hypothetical protein Ddc_16732 [Ditylenchus destructor]|nr:hypothetical protein Ddc_16732 [Ditylenchus destructor]
MHFTTTKDAMIRHCHIAHDVEEQIKPFFERCGRYLRHLTLRKWSPQVVLSFIRMAPNVQHLKLSKDTLNNNFLKELAQLVPGLKSLKVTVRCNGYKPNYDIGLIECFKTMTCLEYLSIYDKECHNRGTLFNLHSFVQFPLNLKYLDLDDVANAAQIISWVSKECHNLKGLCLSCSMEEDTLQAISKLKSELRALNIYNLDEKIITAIAQHCQKLEHLSIVEISLEEHANLLHLATLPNLCSLETWAKNFPKERTTELINRLISIGKLQNIQSIGLEFGRINLDFYSKICQVVDEIDEEQREQHEFTGMTHPIVEVQCNSGLAKFIPHEYKWLQFVDIVWPGRGVWKMSLEKWQYGMLSAGKP